MHSGMRKVPFAHSLVLVISTVLFMGSFALPSSAEAAYGYGGFGTYGSGGTGITTGTICSSPTASNFTPYVYNGHLDSFEYTIENPQGDSHLPLSISVVGEDVDLLYVSVWKIPGSNNVLVHVDVPESIALGKDVEIDVTHLQITQGPPPICISGAVFHVKLADSYTPSVTYPANTTPVSTPTNQPTQQPATNTVPVVNTDTPVVPAATTTGAGEQCTSLGAWWLALLALLDILVSATLLVMMSVIAKTNLRLALAVLIPPAFFIAVWYFFNSCHTNTWLPILAIILAIIVLIGSGTPNAFEGIRLRTLQLFGKRSKNVQMKLAEATSIMEVSGGK